MVKLSTRWTQNPESYDYHMRNKKSIVSAMQGLISGNNTGFKFLSGLVVKKEWCEPEQGDFPNYPFVYTMAKEYIEFAKNLNIPVAEGIVYENFVRYLASLAKQDPAYYTRFNGVLFRVLHDYTRDRITQVDGSNLEYLKFIVKWWDTFDGRERNHELYKKFLDHIVMKYETEEFYRHSIDWCFDWIGKHLDQFVYSDDMNPKKWYGNCGVGFVDNMMMGGTG